MRRSGFIETLLFHQR